LPLSPPEPFPALPPFPPEPDALPALPPLLVEPATELPPFPALALPPVLEKTESSSPPQPEAASSVKQPKPRKSDFMVQNLREASRILKHSAPSPEYWCFVG
jgi:hypothetical protein